MKTIRLTLVVLGFCVCADVFAQQVTLRCIHTRGDRLYNGVQEVTVSRQGEIVTVRPTNGGGMDDNWTYRIVFEEPAVAFRAIRVLRTDGRNSSLNAVVGGELFYIVDGNVQRIEATAINAANAQLSAATLTCRNAA